MLFGFFLSFFSIERRIDKSYLNTIRYGFCTYFQQPKKKKNLEKPYVPVIRFVFYKNKMEPLKKNIFSSLFIQFHSQFSYQKLHAQHDAAAVDTQH